MCIAIVQPAGRLVAKQSLINSFDNNPDGGGFAYVKDGKVEISKGFMRIEDFLEEHEFVTKKYGDANAVLIHTRIATAGIVSEDNCHPFKIKGGAMIHNGHLWSVKDGWNAKKSDTREFAEMFFNILDFDSVIAACADGKFDDIIGGDKMAFLYDDGRFATAGKWEHDDGCLFSNSGYKYSYHSYDAWNYRSMYA